MYTYDKLFSEYNHTVAQILLVGLDIENETRRNNFKNTLSRLLEMHVLPIINENDTVSTDEIVIGDNDTLSSIVASTIKADLLVLLSDIDGLYTADPHTDPNAKLIQIAHKVDEALLSLAGSSASSQGTGGMITKLQAAKICLDCGCEMIIANGNRPENLYDIMDGKEIGTKFSGVMV